MKTHLRPARPDLVVWLPDGSATLPPEGSTVYLDAYWHRRITDGDVLIVPPDTSSTTPEQNPA
ncbi:DUF2635 domain-containing protein [Jeongeupia naejangsanensis]|uniref:DUF2635 domain-containing protein n=1 Tax=Jeongeupia naejangsanensis TaxID=613195 RepID=A0ABS2BHB5_9NEIS|nr:DUF2635 domain-containing protein [Jeongeupia naejangsanensis]MBM3114991.1 DUF2635 domain-containing protein [Jeongeupia naejangsanensis]